MWAWMVGNQSKNFGRKKVFSKTIYCSLIPQPFEGKMFSSLKSVLQRYNFTKYIRRCVRAGIKSKSSHNPHEQCSSDTFFFLHNLLKTFYFGILFLLQSLRKSLKNGKKKLYLTIDLTDFAFTDMGLQEKYIYFLLLPRCAYTKNLWCNHISQKWL